MSAHEGTLVPVAIALHTRDRQDDYCWFAAAGIGMLTDILKTLHRSLLTDQDAQPSPLFALVDHEQKIGILVGQLETERKDHTGTRLIDDALLLEFGIDEREKVLRFAAALLTDDSKSIRQTLLEYAEARFREKQKFGSVTLETLPTPMPTVAPEHDELLSFPHVGLRATNDALSQVAGLLMHLANNPSSTERPFVLVSTGFVGREKLHQQAIGSPRFVALTRSPSFPEGEMVDLGSVGGEKKKAEGRPLMSVVTIFLVLLGISLLAAWQLGDRFLTSSDTQSSANYKKKSDVSERNSNVSVKKSKGSGEQPSPDEIMELTPSSAAAVVGLGAITYGSLDAALLLSLARSKK